MKKEIFAVILFALYLISCQNNDQAESTQEVENTQTVAEQTRFFNPPIPKFNPRFSEYSVNTERDTTILHPSGTMIDFPANVLVDKNGNLVKGEVKIKFRELTNPLNFILSGIPMEYDSAGVEYTFESMGMAEMYAYQNGEPVFINSESEKKPVVHIAMDKRNSAKNQYYLDTAQGKWVYEGQAQITDLSKEKDLEKEWKKLSNVKINVQEPIEPKKESGRPSFFITIDPASVPELKQYDKLSFEITENEKKYKPEYAKTLWDNVTIDKGGRAGTYNVTFSKGEQQITFETYPLLPEEDLKKAMENYKKEKQIADRKRDSIKNLIAQQKEMIELERKRIEEYNRKLEENRKAYYARVKARNDSIARVMEKKERVYVALNFSQFGVWNCDNPMLASGNTIHALFKDEKNKEPFVPQEIYAVYKNYNARFPIGSYNNFAMKYLPGTETMIIGFDLNKDKVYYISPEAFEQSDKVKDQMIVLLKSKNINDVKDIKKLLGV
ncbi:MAG TPA: hypothetical protein DIU39_05475 [Flavobacteriales bacterium]|nr:hypothetical protein [Flavobacteriales bacterium]